MFTYDVRNVHDALPRVLADLAWKGSWRDSRNGSAIMFPGPVVTIYRRPEERVLFHPRRDANPFFHFFESLWMLAGRNDVAYVARFAKRIKTYSDDGRTFNAAYGHRWRVHFGVDQLAIVIERLKADPDDRRCVVQMWTADDLGKASKDLACNTQVVFQRNPAGALDMTVFNRSNDIVWGAYGANAVHFSMLHEYMARCIGCETGLYYQISTNFHAYQDVYQKMHGLPNDPGARENPYATGEVAPFPVMQVDQRTWDQDLLMFMDEPSLVGFRDPFFRRVAVPMWHAHAAYIGDKTVAGADAALEIMAQCQATDWRRACNEWLARRRVERERKGDE